MPAERRLFLIDGYALIYRAFFAMMHRPLRTSRGENTSAVFGVTRFILRLIERHAPTHLGWVHDAGTSFRHEAFPEYKATRERLTPDLQADFDRSVERVEQVLGALHVPLITVDGYEADDVLGTLATQAAAAGVPTVLVSGDKDLYQLVSKDISLLNPGRGGPAAVEEQWVNTGNAMERLGVPPEHVVDFLALVGDASDNVPGVRGVGEKTARRLIDQWGDLESVLAHAGDAPGRKVQEALRADADRARLSRELVTIRRDVPVALDMERLAARPPDLEALRRLFVELEFHDLLHHLAPADAPGPSAARATRVVADPRAVAAMVKSLAGGPVLLQAICAGTTGPSRELVGLVLAGEAGPVWYLPFGHGTEQHELMTHGTAGNLPPLSDPAMRPVAELLETPAIAKWGHDLKAAVLALRAAGVDLQGLEWDGMLASYLVDPGRRSHDLEDLALDLEHLALDGVSPKGKEDVPALRAAAEVGAAGGRTVEAIAALRRRLLPQVTAGALTALLRDVELPLVTVLAAIEWRGVAVDVDRLRALSSTFGEELGRLERAIYQEAGTEFNIQSTPQLRHVLFEKLQLPSLKRTKTGPSTDADVLEQLAALRFTVPALLLEYRELSKLKSTYVDVLPGRVDARTGRIHARFHQTGAATGRLSSSDPNLQNIPVRTPRGERIRECFVAPRGARLIVADYSQIELRLLAHLSGDPGFLQAFERGDDVHRQTAATIFGVDPADVTADMRARAKTINFATIYGQGPFALSRQLGISVDEAREFIRLYFERFAGVRRYLDGTVNDARERGYVETLLGRRRYIPELRDTNRAVRAFGERTAMNSPLQGSAADLIKVAMVRVHADLSRRRLAGGMLLQVHDELVLEAPEAEVPEVTQIVRGEMERAATLRIPLVVEVGVGTNWLEAKQ